MITQSKERTTNDACLSYAHERVEPVLVVGAGRMGQAVAEELLLTTRAEVHLTDSRRAARDTAQFVLDQRVPGITSRLQIHDKVGEIAGRAVILCIPWTATSTFLDMARCSMDQGPIVSITRPDYAALPRLADLGAVLERALYLPVGLEPGLVELLALAVRQAAPQLDHLVVGCGGIPSRPTPPLFHRLMFGDRIPCDARRAWFVQDGEPAFSTRFADPKPVAVPGVGLLEAYHDGMMPTTATAPQFSNLTRFEQRTLRWPGFAERVTLLREMGFFSTSPVDVGGTSVAPIDFTHAALASASPIIADAGDIGLIHIECARRNDEACSITLRWTGDETQTAVAIATAVTAVAVLRHHRPGLAGWHGPTSSDFPIDATKVVRRLCERSSVTILGTGALLPFATGLQNSHDHS